MKKFFKYSFLILSFPSFLYGSYYLYTIIEDKWKNSKYSGTAWGLDQDYDILVQRNILGRNPDDNAFYPLIIDDAVYRYEGYIGDEWSRRSSYKEKREKSPGCFYRMYNMNDRVNYLDQEVLKYLQQHHINYTAIDFKGYNIQPVSDLKNPISYLRLYDIPYDGRPDPNQNVDTTQQFFVQPSYQNGVKAGIRTPWIKLSDLTQDKVFKHAEPYNFYPYYQYCLQFLQDNQPDVQKDMFKNMKKSLKFTDVDLYFEEEFRQPDYAKKYRKADFVDVITAQDTLVKYSQNFLQSDIYFFNQRKKIFIYLHTDFRWLFPLPYSDQDFDKQ